MEKRGLGKERKWLKKQINATTGREMAYSQKMRILEELNESKREKNEEKSIKNKIEQAIVQSNSQDKKALNDKIRNDKEHNIM